MRNNGFEVQPERERESGRHRDRKRVGEEIN